MGKKQETITIEFGNKTYVETIENNIELSELTPDEVMNALNRAVGKYALYGALRADAKRIDAQVTTDFEAWKALKYHEIQSLPEYAKATVKTLDAQIILQNEQEWRMWNKKKAKIALITDKLWVLVQSFELMTKTLQSILAMQRIELTNAANSGFAHTGDLLTD